MKGHGIRTTGNLASNHLASSDLTALIKSVAHTNNEAQDLIKIETHLITEGQDRNKTVLFLTTGGQDHTKTGGQDRIKIEVEQIKEDQDRTKIEDHLNKGSIDQASTDRNLKKDVAHIILQKEDLVPIKTDLSRQLEALLMRVGLQDKAVNIEEDTKGNVHQAASILRAQDPRLEEILSPWHRT